jgi:uncharacterized protein
MGILACSKGWDVLQRPRARSSKIFTTAATAGLLAAVGAVTAFGAQPAASQPAPLGLQGLLGALLPSTPQTPTSTPAASQPETSQATTSQPETSQPTTSQPETSQPTTSQPETSQPAAVQSPAAPAIALGGMAGSGVPQSQPIYGATEVRNIPVTMKDGTVLRVNVYYPTDPQTGQQAAGPFPVLLTQTPYGKDDPLIDSLGGGELAYLVDRGYIEVVADVRGRGASGGTFNFWGPQERLDGVQLADFASKLPHSNGNVGLYGGSYMGQTQLLTESVAGTNSPIKAAVPIVSIDDAPQDGFYGGMANFGFGLLYAGIFPITGAISVADDTDPTDPIGLLERTAEDNTGSLGFSYQLVENMLLGGPAAYDQSSFWYSRDIQPYLAQIAATHIPNLVVGGFYDIMGKGSSMIYTGLQDALMGRPTYLPLPANAQTAPWIQWANGDTTHTGSISAPATQALELLWFDHYLKGIANGVDSTGSTEHLQVIGTNDWINSTAWPLQTASSQVYYLGPRAQGSALSLNNGTLTTTPPTAASAHDSVAWTGVASPCSSQFKVQTAGLLDQLPALYNVCGPNTEWTTELGGLTYTTAPLSKTEVVAGPIGVNLWASSNKPNAEFIVDVSLVSSNGQAQSMQTGALLGSWHETVPAESWYDASGDLVQPYHPFTPSSKELLTPNRVYDFQIGVEPTAFEVPAGDSIRVTITTSDPPYAVPSVQDIPDLVGSVYQVERSSAYPSYVNIPFVDPADMSASD